MKRLAFGAVVLVAFAVIVGSPSMTSRPTAAGLPEPSVLMSASSSTMATRAVLTTIARPEHRSTATAARGNIIAGREGQPEESRAHTSGKSRML